MVSTQVGGGVRVVRDWMDCRPLLMTSVVVSKTATAWQQSSPEIAISSRQEVLFNHRFKKHTEHILAASPIETHNTTPAAAVGLADRRQHSLSTALPTTAARSSSSRRPVQQGELEWSLPWFLCADAAGLDSYRGGVHVRPAAPRARSVALNVT